MAIEETHISRKQSRVSTVYTAAEVLGQNAVSYGCEPTGAQCCTGSEEMFVVCLHFNKKHFLIKGDEWVAGKLSSIRLIIFNHHFSATFKVVINTLLLLLEFMTAHGGKEGSVCHISK